jgi:hypothetical protein
MRSVLKLGLTHADLVQVVRGLYITAIRDQLVQQDRPVTAARLALMTGVTRGEAEHIIEYRARRRAARVQNTNRVDRLSLLLTIWHDDSRFSTPYGAPVDLSLVPDGKFKTFDDLFSAAPMDIDRDTALDALVASGCVEVHDGKFVRCVNRTFIPAGVDVSGISRLGRFVGALNSTFVHNLLRRADEPSYFERVFVSDAAVSAEYRDQLLGKLREEGQSFLDKLCRWSAEKEESLRDPAGKRYGVGLYFYEDVNGEVSSQGPESLEVAGTA